VQHQNKNCPSLQYVNRLLLSLSSYNTQKSNINLVPTGTILIRNLETLRKKLLENLKVSK